MSKWCFTCSIFCTYCFFTLLYIFLCVISFHLPPPSSSFFGEERGQGPGPGPIESYFFDVFLQCCVPVLFVLIYTQHLILTNSQVSLLRFILFEVQTLHRKESASARVCPWWWNQSKLDILPQNRIQEVNLNFFQLVCQVILLFYINTALVELAVRGVRTTWPGGFHSYLLFELLLFLSRVPGTVV